MWYWCIATSIVIIAFFWTSKFRVQGIFTPFSLVGCAIIFSSLLFAIHPVQPLTLFHVVLVFLLSLTYVAIITSSDKNRLLFSVIFLGFCSLYAQWGIAQFVIQHDLGLVKIGESTLNHNTSGVASFYIGSQKYIRSYGPFSHANSFAGVLLLGIIILYKIRDNLQSNIFTQSILFVLSLGVLTSFSRTALIGLGSLLALYVFKKKLALVAPILIACALVSGLLFHRSTDTKDMATHDRLMGLSWYLDIMDSKLLIRGVGLGNYTHVLAAYVGKNNITHDPWDIAPIHSVPLLLLAELGIIVFGALCIITMQVTYLKKYLLYIALVPGIVFDHYFATQLAPVIFLIISTQLVVY